MLRIIGVFYAVWRSKFYPAPVRYVEACRMTLMKLSAENERAVLCVEPLEMLECMNSDVPPTILDMRSENEFQAAHIHGAQWVSQDDLWRVMQELSPEQHYVTVCRSGATSGIAAWHLRAAGFDAQNLCGGLLAWQRAGLDVERDN